jgi:hypothetical protein
MVDQQVAKESLAEVARLRQQLADSERAQARKAEEAEALFAKLQSKVPDSPNLSSIWLYGWI